MSQDDHLQDLLAYIHASPTPQHCVAASAERLQAGGFTELRETNRWDLQPGGAYYVARDGGLVALRVGTSPASEAGFRLIGAHTDSPNLRVKPLANVSAKGFAQLGVEVYGGALTYTWLDRDLGLAGVVVLAGEGDPTQVERRLVNIQQPILRVPSLAIHLNRDIRKDGLQLNDQKHLVPILSGAPAEATATPTDKEPGKLESLLARTLNVSPQRILAWDLSLMDVTPPALGGENQEFIFSPRLDNQAMSHAALRALLAAPASSRTQVACLYDHEEVGSGSVSGAGGSLVEDVLGRVAETEGPGAKPGDLRRAVAHSYQLSADMAHGLHPNYADRHEPQHHPLLNQGPVIKINAQQRYATSSEGAGLFAALCQEEGIEPQRFVTRTDLPCGSTIGPISAARLGIRTVDVGNAMLSMHSIREQAGAKDHAPMVAVMTRFFAS